MASVFSSSSKSALLLKLVNKKDFEDWKNKQSSSVKNWLNANEAVIEAGSAVYVPGQDGGVEFAVGVYSSPTNIWSFAQLIESIKPGSYGLDSDLNEHDRALFYAAWGCVAYRYDRYKKSSGEVAQLVITDEKERDKAISTFEAMKRVRDLINTPANDMGPDELQAEAEKFAKAYGATCEVTVDQQLLENNFPAIYTVGQASDRRPRLIDIRWGNGKGKKITLVGKGVCFDSGGLDLKPSRGMLTMKKDMGGAAHVLGLAQMIMDAKLPVQLRVLIPAVENSVSGNAFRPLDVICMRSGKTVEVTNTDAEGRLVLADALHEADSENPDLIIDMATLTGAARVAMGTDVPAVFSNDDALAQELVQESARNQDWMWQLPLWEGYKVELNSSVANMTSTGSALGGAIIAALFLAEFVSAKTKWVHIDLMAWNQTTRPGRPYGGEAMGLRGLFSWIKKISA